MGYPLRNPHGNPLGIPIGFLPWNFPVWDPPWDFPLGFPWDSPCISLSIRTPARSPTAALLTPQAHVYTWKHIPGDTKKRELIYNFKAMQLGQKLIFLNASKTTARFFWFLKRSKILTSDRVTVLCSFKRCHFFCVTRYATVCTTKTNLFHTKTQFFLSFSNQFFS